MRNDQGLIDDMITLGGNVLGHMLGARQEIKAQAKQRIDVLARQLDLVSREEFDAAFAMLAKTRAMQEELNERLTAIESHLGLSRTKKQKASTKKHLPSVKHNKRAHHRAR